MSKEKPQAYKTIASETTAKLTEKNSRFIAYAKSINSEEDAMAYLQTIQEEHSKASHHCYALKIGTSGHLFRANDDGEPSGSAGRPILGQINSFELTNIIVIVVRYYGGVNLGVSGLIQAYKGAASLALEQAKIIEQYERLQLVCTIAYAKVNEFQEWVNQTSIQIIEETYTNTAGVYTLEFPKHQLKTIQQRLVRLDAKMKPINE